MVGQGNGSKDDLAEMNRLTLITNAERPTAKQPAVMLDYIRYFQSAFLAAFPDATETAATSIDFKRQLLRLFRRTYRHLPLRGLRAPAGRHGGRLFTAICGNDFAYCLPHYLRSGRKFIYIFDAWPRNNLVLVDWVRLLSIEKVFFSALQSSELFNSCFPPGDKRGVWVPEGIISEPYRHVPYQKKNIDVLEFGRRFDWYHDRITDSLRSSGFTHAYNTGKYGTVHMSEKQQVVDAFARSKISICFPSSITHPQRAEHISTMTLRYLESMLSKCLVVGSRPLDMQFLFDHNPIIEVDKTNPAGQLAEILRNYNDYIPLIEKNYESALNGHLWSHRMKVIREHIS